MIWDLSFRFLRPNGASDWEDAPVISTLVVLFLTRSMIYNWPDMRNFIDPETGKYRRCENPKYDVSRDQTICLALGLYLQGHSDLVSLDRVNGRDIFAPGNRGHIKRCQGLKASWFENLWLIGEILWFRLFTPLDEPNQLICQMWIAGKFYLWLWTFWNSNWEKSINQYWFEGYINDKGEREGNWRDEQWLAINMIDQIKNRLGNHQT